MNSCYKWYRKWPRHEAALAILLCKTGGQDMQNKAKLGVEMPFAALSLGCIGGPQLGSPCERGCLLSSLGPRSLWAYVAEAAAKASVGWLGSRVEGPADKSLGPHMGPTSCTVFIQSLFPERHLKVALGETSLHSNGGIHWMHFLSAATVGSGLPGAWAARESVWEKHQRVLL